MTPRALAVAAAAGASLAVWGEWHTWRASRQGYPDDPRTGPADARDVVLVLGFPGRRDGSAGLLQRWRTRIALRSAPPGALLVFSGGAVRGAVAESDVMADLAERHGIPRDRIVRETTATTTRENLTRSLPWLSGARTIRIASNTFHARRARQYLRAIDPDLHARLRPTRDFVPLELGPLRIALTFYDFVAARVAAGRDAAASVSAASPPGSGGA